MSTPGIPGFNNQQPLNYTDGPKNPAAKEEPSFWNPNPGEDKGYSYTRARYRYMLTFRWHQWAVVGVMTVTFYFMVLPAMVEHWREILRLDRPMLDPEYALPNISTTWWVNQWRIGKCWWRSQESMPGFHIPNFDWMQECTGRNWLEYPSELAAKAQASLKGKKGKALEQAANAFELPRAFVPMCGDSPIVRELARLGYRVDAVDCADVPIRDLAIRSDTLLEHEPGAHARIKLHLSDIFRPKFWSEDLGMETAGTLRRIGERHDMGIFDIIYDRQGINAMDPASRDDYAYLLKRALKKDGVIYTEGAYRTARIDGNRNDGPPFHFKQKDLEQHYGLEDGWIVKCKEIKEIKREELPAEARITGRIPKDLYTRYFPCAVWQDEAAAKQILQQRMNSEFEA